MSAQHTPGPWLAERVPQGEAIHGTTHRVTALTADEIDTRTIAYFGGDDAQRNAQIASAAPDLLAALRIAEASLAALSHPDCGKTEGDPLHTIRAAIAKATGSAAA